jgi:N12 class adenine-specific DNA methylase
MSRISTGDHDLIIVPHSAFKLLPLSQETVARYIRREIDTLEEYLEGIPREERRDQQKTIKEIQKAIKKLEVKLKDCVSAIKRDSKHTITWEELGVDVLMVDECHLYKNLYCPTKMRNVAGLPTADSQRAFDAFIKVRSLLDSGGRVVFASATPVSNTLAEVYVMMKFLQFDTLEEMGIAHFDAWTQLFAETSQSLEMKPDASGFRLATRFNKFTNLPELAALWRQVLDVKNADQLNLPRPKIAGGAPQVITIPASPELKEFVKSLAARVEAIKSRRVSPDVDNMLRITSEGRKAALDIRLVMPNVPRPAHSKIEALADKVVEFYRQSQNDRGAQLVFCDLVNCRPVA